jgi:hypothetical protein
MDMSTERIKVLQAVDKEIAHWIAISEDRAEDDRRVKNDIFCWEGVLMTQLPKRKGFLVNRPKIVLPEAMRKEALEQAHNSVIAGHGGFFKTRERIREM